MTGYRVALARLSDPLLGLAALLICVPVITVVYHLTLPAGETWGHLAATVLPRYVQNTLWLMLAVGIGTLIGGVGTAWLVVMCRFPGRRLFEWALILPLAMPTYVIAYVYTDFFQVSGPVQTAIRALTGWSARDYWFPEIRSLGGAMVLFSLTLYPYVYLAARAAFVQQCACVLEAGRTLGCSPGAAFSRIALPMARPALAAGVALVLMETLAEFGAVSYFGVQTFTTGIYRAWFSLGDRVAAAQLSTMLLAFVVMLLLVEHLTRRGARYFDTSRQVRALSRYELAGWRRWAATGFCLVPVVLGFALPAGILVGLAWDGAAGQIGARSLVLISNSVTLAAVTAVLAVGLGLMLAYGMRRSTAAIPQAAGRVAGLGYAIPGSIVAVGVLIPAAAFDNALDGWLRQTFGISTGLLLTGSIAALVFAYLVRFLAVSLRTIQGGLERITPSMDAAAATLGAGRLRTLARVHVPMLRGSLLAAFLLVFVDVMKELPATLIMRPFNYDTLAVQTYNLAADERLAEAAVPALAIVLVGLIPVIMLSNLIARSRTGHGQTRQAAPPAAGPLSPAGLAPAE